MANKISVLIDVSVDRANQALKGFRQSITDAEGATGKLKAGASSAFDSIKANAGNLAMAGGAALITFGAKSVTAFQDTALEAGKLRDSLGLTAEEASRLMEVAGDLDIPVKNLENSIGKMNIAAARTPEVFAGIGAEMAKNADGSMNVQQTFLNTVDALNKIPDASARASAAQKIFGKDWRTISELIGRGSEELQENLAAVGEGKVMTDEKIQSARDFRDKLDELSDAASDVTHMVGGELVPALTDLASVILLVKDGAQGLGNILPGPVSKGIELVTDQVKRSLQPWRYVTDAIDLFGGKSEEAAKVASSPMWDEASDAVADLASRTAFLVSETKDLGESVDWTRSSYGPYESAVEDTTEAIQEQENATREAEHALRKLRDEMNDRSGLLNLQTGFDELKAVGLEALQAVSEGSADAEQKTRDFELAQIDLKNEVIDYAEEVGNIPAQTQTAILALIDQGKLEEAEAALTNLMRPRSTQGTIIIKSAGAPKGTFAGRPGDLDNNPWTDFAEGGIVKARPGGMLARIGEAGHDEAVIPLSGPNAPKGIGGSPTYNFTINGATDPDAVVRAIREHVKRNGPIQGIT